MKKTIMTISGPVSLSLYRICVIFGILLCLTSCARTGDNKEEHYDTYETFKDRQEKIAPYLPESSTEIQHYAILDFDTNYHFIEATVKIESLSNFLFLNNNFEGQFTCSDITYSDQKFDRLFYKSLSGGMRKAWLVMKKIISASSLIPIPRMSAEDAGFFMIRKLRKFVSLYGRSNGFL